MDDQFRIPIEQLRHGGEYQINEYLDPSFLGINEVGLQFEKPVYVRGVASLANDDLVICWDINAEAIMRCKICNEKVVVPIAIKREYHNEQVKNIKHGIYNFTEPLREAVLLEVPLFSECAGGCALRDEMSRYFLEYPKVDSKDQKEEGYHPFADLENLEQ